MKKILIIAAIMSLTACEKGYFGIVGVKLSPARDVTGIWKGTLTCSDNKASQTNQRTDVMILNLTMSGNNVTGTMTFGNDTGNLTGTINGVKIKFSTMIGNGCINVHGTFTSDLMEAMKGAPDPPYLTCGDVLNDGHGSKGIEWHLTKQ